MPLPSSFLRDFVFHPGPGIWSVLEYSCHVRDVMFNIRDRILLALVEDRPRFAPIHREERVSLAHYAEETAADVATGIRLGGDLLARVIDGLTPEQFRRGGTYAGADRDVLWIGRQALHEATHHLRDIDRGLARVSGQVGL